MPKTKLNGAYSVYERINENLGDFGASASVVEVIEQDFDEIKEALDLAIEKAAQNTKTLIVASEFFAKEEENIEAQESAIDIKKSNSIPDEIEEINIDSELDFLISQELEPRNIMFKEPSNKKPQSAYDRNSIKLFNQAYVRKLKVVVNPVFKKYENFLKTKRQDFDIDCFVGTKSEFSVNLRGVCASITIEYDGVERAFVQLMITQDNQKKLYETSQVDFTILDYQRMSTMMNQLISKFFAVLKKCG